MSWTVQIPNALLLLEELEAAARYDGHVAKVNEVHLYVSGAEDPVDHHPVEPHSFRTHAANLATPHKPFREAVAIRHLRTLVTSSEEGKKHSFKIQNRCDSYFRNILTALNAEKATKSNSSTFSA